MDFTYDDIEEWVKKTSAVEKAIRGIAEGTIDYNTLNLESLGLEEASNQYGEVLQKDKEFPQIKAIEKHSIDRAEVKQHLEKTRERETWWEGARLLHGSSEGCAYSSSPRTVAVSESHVSKHPIDRIKERFSCDYSRWSDSSFRPGDPVTIEENERKQKLEEQDNLAKFEANNKEFCAKFHDDMERRQTMVEQSAKRAATHRLHGNRLFRSKKYEGALECYKKALKEDPYTANILTNIALTYSKLQQWRDCLEFSSRALHLDKTCLKAHIQCAKAYFELGQIDEADSQMKLALQFHPLNTDLITYNDSLQNDILERKTTEAISKLRANLADTDTSQHDQSYWDKLSLHAAAEDIGDDWLDANFLALLDRALDSIIDSSNNSIQEQQYHLIISFVSKSTILRGYIRLCGYLETLCKYLKNIEKSPKLGFDEKVKIALIFDLLEACTFQDCRSLTYIVQVDALNVVKHFAFCSVKEAIDAKLKVKAWSVLASGLKLSRNSCSTYIDACLKGSKLVKNLSFLLAELILSRDFAEYQEQGIEILTDFFSACTDTESYRNRLSSLILESEKNDRCNLLGSLTLPLALSLENMLIIPDNGRSRLLDCMHKFSIIEELRHLFVIPLSDKKNSHSWTPVFVLVEIIKSYQTETVDNREAALACLANVTLLPKASKKSSEVANEICWCGGYEALFDIVVSNNENRNTDLIKVHASTILSRLVSSIGKHKLASNSSAVTQLASIFVSLVRNDEGSAESHEKKSRGRKIAANLIRIIAEVKLNPQVEGFIESLVFLLPSPMKDSNGAVTARSVCQKPDLSFNESISQSLICSVLAALVNFMDHDGQKEGLKIDIILVEKLVCILANYKSFHQTVVKSAAALLARITKSTSKNAVARCHELRGIQIMLDLNRGKFI